MVQSQIFKFFTTDMLRNNFSFIEEHHLQYYEQSCNFAKTCRKGEKLKISFLSSFIRTLIIMTETCIIYQNSPQAMLYSSPKTNYSCCDVLDVIQGHFHHTFSVNLYLSKLMLFPWQQNITKMFFKNFTVHQDQKLNMYTCTWYQPDSPYLWVDGDLYRFVFILH